MIRASKSNRCLYIGREVRKEDGHCTGGDETEITGG